VRHIEAAIRSSIGVRREAPGEQSFGEAFTTVMSADAQTVASLVAPSAGGRVIVY